MEIASDDSSLGDLYVLFKENVPKERFSSLKRSYDWICTLCNRGFKDKKSAKAHVTTDIHMTNVKDEELNTSLLKLPLPSNDHLSKLTEFVERIFQDQSAVSNGTIAIRKGIATQLQVYVQKEFPEVSVGLHGSSLSGYALLSSDVNINLSIPESDSQNPIPAVMEAVKKILLKETRVYSKVVEDYYSYNRIPRILFTHKKSKLNGEIRVNVGSPLSMSLILNLYQRINHRVLQLAVVFRYWAKVCRVDCQEDGHYPAHMYIIMVIHFLQQRRPPIVPVLHEMFDQLQPKESVQGTEPEYISSKIIEEVSKDLISWKQCNFESLGQLWLDLFKYYAVEFNINKFAVSILQSELLPRERNQWGSCRLAVEDPMISRSNLARAGSSDKVFLYLWSSLKQSTVYFGQSRNPDYHGIVKSSKSLMLDDDSIVCAFSNLPKPSCEKTVSSSPSLLSKSNSKNKNSVKSNVEPDLGYVEDSVQSSEVHTAAEEDIPDQYKSDDDSNFVASTHGTGVSSSSSEILHKKRAHSSNQEVKVTTTKEKDDSHVFRYHMLKDNFIYHSYPVTCLSCKRLRHNIKNCPSEKLPSWTSKLPTTLPSLPSLRSMRDAFKHYIKVVSPAQDEQKRREEMCSMILQDISNVYPDAQLELFGSSANGFSSYQSDLDLCLTLPQIPVEKMDKGDLVVIISEVAKELKKHRGKYREVLTITSARVPIVKFSLVYYNQDCDISLDNQLALRNTKMIASYANLDNRVRQLGYVVKYFAKMCDMGDAATGSLSSYAYILMVIHYLQRTHPPVVPCLQQIPVGYPKGPTISNWNCYYYEKAVNATVWPDFKKNQESIGQLWLGFLRYYLDFNWSKQVVTIRQLQPLSKIDKWWLNKLMCIEDPFNLDHNLAAAIGAKMRMYILERFCCALCHHSKELNWKSINHLMDPKFLVGDEHAPKFIICHICNHRGHKAISCPNKVIEKKKSKHNHHRKADDPPQQGYIPQSQYGSTNPTVNSVKASISQDAKVSSPQTPPLTPSVPHPHSTSFQAIPNQALQQVGLPLPYPNVHNVHYPHHHPVSVIPHFPPHVIMTPRTHPLVRVPNQQPLQPSSSYQVTGNPVPLLSPSPSYQMIGNSKPNQSPLYHNYVLTDVPNRPPRTGNPMPNQSPNYPMAGSFLPNQLPPPQPQPQPHMTGNSLLPHPNRPLLPPSSYPVTGNPRQSPSNYPMTMSHQQHFTSMAHGPMYSGVPVPEHIFPTTGHPSTEIPYPHFQQRPQYK